MRKSARALWGAPIALGVSSMIGLVAALLDDGIWDLAGWIGLGAPVLVMLRYAVRPRHRATAGARKISLPQHTR